MNEPPGDSSPARLAALQQGASILEPQGEQFQQLLNEVTGYAQEFLGALDRLPAFVENMAEGPSPFEAPISEEPEHLEKLLEIVRKDVDTPGINTASGGHLGYIPGCGIVHAALGDFLAAITNRYAGIFYASPGAVRMENLLLRWMAALVGYPKGAAGNLASGGSVANLIAVVAARDAHGLQAQNYHRAVVYSSEQVHHCLDKALRIAGMAECIIRMVPLDSAYRVDALALERQIEKDQAGGLSPWLVVASAGTTDTGAIDPLRRIGEIANAHALWYHIDAAYGGFFMLCPEGQAKLSGLELSDSIVLDPHKGLFLPFGTGAVLVKNGDALLASHRYHANYLQDVAVASTEISPADVSPELSKHFRGLRVWLPLKALGLKPFRAALSEKIHLARYFYEKLQQIDGFELGPFPDLSVVTFRYVPDRGEADQFNRDLLSKVLQDGRIFISSTLINGRFTLRVAVLSVRTHLQTIDLFLEILQTAAKELDADL